MAATPNENSRAISRDKDPCVAALLLPEAEACAQDPYSVKSWVAWLDACGRLPHSTRYAVHEKSVAALPGSYKLWRLYSRRVFADSKTCLPTHPIHAHAVDVALRAARALRAAPRLWEDALEVCAERARILDARNAFDDALRALPVSQHDRIWRCAVDTYIALVPPKSKAAIFERWAQLRPHRAAVPLFDSRRDAKLFDAAVKGLLKSLADEKWEPTGSRTRDQLWVEAATLAAAHPTEVSSVDVPKMLRDALKGDDRLSHGLQAADLYKLLAKYYVRAGKFDDVRQVYEEAITTTSSVRDFTILFDAYSKFEEALVAAAMEDLTEAKEDGDAEEVAEVERGVEEILAKLEKLADRRPTLLSDVRLRQNPHNVHEWHKRARMFKKNNETAEVVECYTQAVATVDARIASNGRPHTLWLAFAAYYEKAGDLSSARKVLEKAVSDASRFATPQDAAAVWCEYAEMELRQNLPLRALAVLKRGTKQPEEDRKRKMHSESSEAVKGINGIIQYEHMDTARSWGYWKSSRLWAFYLDMVWCLEDVTKFVDAMHKVIDIGAMDAQVVCNAGACLIDRRLFEQAFRIYDRAAHKLVWADALQVWAAYLTAFTERHGAKKRERTRALWEDALAVAPARKRGGRERPNEDAPLLHDAYARWEEQNNAAPRAAKTVRARAANLIGDGDSWRAYVAAVGRMFGATSARPVYEEALSALTDEAEALKFAVRFAKLETALGEIDRARAVYRHGAAVADANNELFWKEWGDFEVAHGREDDFRDILRARRVQVIRRGATHVPMATVGDTREEEKEPEEAADGMLQREENGKVDTNGTQ